MSSEEKIKAGIEIHQQLDTHKLFCSCPSILRNDEPAFIVKRKLHAVAGEGGEIDRAALHEAHQDKEFIYQGYDTTCLVELDEEPPHLLNAKALEIALHVAFLLNCEVIPLTQIMRKTVIDGSNTSGFQRTVLIARDGFIETAMGKIRIENISLEEDAARIIGKESGKTIFRLDRLGIPLIEIGTAPDITSAEQCKEVALFIGDVLRSCNVKRGIGTIRQDINISIAEHPRVEIKGFQDVKLFIPTIEKEIKRQKENLASGKPFEGEVRNATPTGETVFLRPLPGASRMYPETDLPLLRISRDMINQAKKTIPAKRSALQETLKKKGLREEEARILLREGLLEEFEALLHSLPDPRFIYRIIMEFPKDIAAREKKSVEEVNSILTLDVLAHILSAFNDKKIQRDDFKHVMEQIVRGIPVEKAITLDKLDMTEVESEIARLIKEKPGLSMGGYMGLIMGKFKGKLSGNDASGILKKLLV